MIARANPNNGELVLATKAKKGANKTGNAFKKTFEYARSELGVL